MSSKLLFQLVVQVLHFKLNKNHYKDALSDLNSRQFSVRSHQFFYFVTVTMVTAGDFRGYPENRKFDLRRFCVEGHFRPIIINMKSHNNRLFNLTIITQLVIICVIDVRIYQTIICGGNHIVIHSYGRLTHMF